ncbi:hypothetical protein P4H94_13495, partial [Paenibacillus macerans]|uniref:hypothetical protein n=1 Tax=Paenibacillus macerans TaxID=44252 RepID=UPI002DBF30EF
GRTSQAAGFTGAGHGAASCEEAANTPGEHFSLWNAKCRTRHRALYGSRDSARHRTGDLSLSHKAV